MKPSEIIRESKCILFERGWCKEALENERGEVCALGAINVAATGMACLSSLGHYPRDVVAAKQSLSSAISEPLIYRWNNDSERTFDEVIEALDRAEKLAEQAECDALLREEGAK